MRDAALSPDGRTVAVVYDNPREGQPAQGRIGGSVEIWDVATGQMRHWFAIPRRWVAPVFSPDGQTLALVGSDEQAGDDQHAVLLYEAATGREVRRLRGHTERPHGLAFLPNGREAITTGEDGSLRVWDVTTGREVRQFAKPPVSVGEPTLSTDGRWLATLDRPRKQSEGYTVTGGSDKRTESSPIRLWDVATGRETRQLPGHLGGTLHLAFTPDSRRLLSGALDRLIRVWDADSGRELLTLPQGHCRGLALSPDGRTLADAGLRSIRLRDATTGEDRVTVRAPEWGPGIVAPSPDGRTVATTIGTEATINLWEIGTGKLIRRLERSGRFHIIGLSWATDGRTILSAEMGYNHQSHGAHVWDVATGRELPPPMGFDKRFLTFLPSPDGRRVVTVSDRKTAVVWDRATGRPVLEFSPEGYHWTITSDGQKLFSTDGKIAYVWDLTTGQRVNRFFIDPKERFGGATASPDGRWLVVRDGEKVLMLYEAASGREVRRMDVFTGQYGQLAFSPDSRWLAAGDSRQGVVSVWDVATGRKLHEFPGHSGGVFALAFTPDGKRLISGSADTTALVWDVSDLRPAGP
jgi:WD40 repeat protein